MLLIDSWPYDLLVSGEMRLESEITDNPVESGGTTSDHINLMPIEFDAECIVSDTPIGEIAAHESRRVDDVTEAVFGSDLVPLPSEEAYERLTAIRAEKRLVTIEIPIRKRNGKPGKRLLRNMGITSLSLPMNSDTNGGLFFSVTFREMRFTTNTRVTVRVATPQAKPQSPHKATVGVALRTDQRVLWQMGIPPGGVLVPYISPEHPGSPWAVVEIQWSDGKGGPGATSRIFFGGDASTNAPARAQQAGLELNPKEIAAFNADLGRDQALKKKKQEDQLSRDLHEIDETKAYDKNLPPGLDLSRFTPPTNPTPTVPSQFTPSVNYTPTVP